MSADRDMHRVIRSWLHEDRHEDAEPVLDTVLARLDTTPQRRSAWPAWRTPIMNTYLKVGLVAAAVVLAVVVGLQFLGPANVGGPPEPTATPSPEPTAAAEPSTAPDFIPPSGDLAPGTRYAIRVSGATITFAVPAPGWWSDGSCWIRHGEPRSDIPCNNGLLGDAVLWYSVASAVPAIFTDPCAHTGTQEFEASAAGHAEAMASQAGAEVVSAPSPITIDGRTGQFVAIVIPEGIGCDRMQYWLSPDTYWPTWLDGTISTWVVDLGDGQRFTFEVHARPDVAPEFADELQQIVDSIQFE